MNTFPKTASTGPAISILIAVLLAEKFDYSLKSAHRDAQSLMTEEFYWNPIEETAPFGNDDGHDAAYGFRDWRQSHKTTSPVKYVSDLVKEWQYPYFDYYESDTEKIKKYLENINPDESEIQEKMRSLKEFYLQSHDTAMINPDDKQLREHVISVSKGMGYSWILGQDNAIIATGFAQFVLEGYTDDDIRELTIIAIKRQLLPFFIDRYDENYRGKRKQQLNKMLNVIRKSKRQ